MWVCKFIPNFLFSPHCEFHQKGCWLSQTGDELALYLMALVTQMKISPSLDAATSVARGPVLLGSLVYQGRTLSGVNASLIKAIEPKLITPTNYYFLYSCKLPHLLYISVHPIQGLIYKKKNGFIQL